MTRGSSPLVEVKGVSKQFRPEADMVARIAQKLSGRDEAPSVQALDDINLQVYKGEVLGLVGESGCGKSTLGRIIAGFLTPNSGEIWFDGKNVAELRGKEAKDVAMRIQMIFQDPHASLNPRKRIRDIIGEAPKVHGLVPATGLNDYVDNLMSQCGLDPEDKNRFPHQFSGGQRQRIAIARVLAVNADFIVCDEVVSALDVSIQAQVLNLFMVLKNKFSLTTLFISHDLGVVEHVCDRVTIMYLGRIVEVSDTEELFSNPLHPYTQGLLEEVPTLDKRGVQFAAITGEIPSPFDPPSGCQFHPRCPRATAECKTSRPELRELRPGHLVSCHHAE